MKKTIFISLCTLLSGCYIPLDLLFNEYIPKEIINPECDISPNDIYVIQVLNNGVLGEPDSKGPAIYISVKKENLKDIFDEASFRLETNVCLKKDGVYSYIDMLGTKRTIKKFKMITPKFIKNPEYIEGNEQQK